MSEEKTAMDGYMIKTLSLASGEKIITYVKGITELGSYICERPFTIYIDEEDGSYYLVQYNPYADHSSDYIFQALGVVGISDTSDFGKKQYINAVRSEIIQDAKLSGLIDSDSDFDSIMEKLQSKMKETFGDECEMQLDLFERSEESLSSAYSLSNEQRDLEESSDNNIVDLALWKPDTEPN